MGFQKGNNLGGREKGTQNKTTAETKAQLQTLFDKLAESALEDIEELDAKDKLEMLVKLAPYLVPKLATVTAETKQNRQITIIHQTAPLPDGD